MRNQKIEQAQAFVDALGETWIVLTRRDYTAHVDDVAAWNWKKHPVNPDDVITCGTDELIAVLTKHDITHRIERTESEAAKEIRLRVEAVHRWYVHDWNTLDNKIRSSIVEGVSVFLSMFDLPSVARVFCPPPPTRRPAHGTVEPAPANGPGASSQALPPPLTAGVLTQALPPLDQLIDHGKVLALNMPAGTNPALARAIGVMLKNAWLQALLLRPAKMKAAPGRYVRPAVFLCDEYQAFASVGEDDPSGDEEAFALTRQCRVIPIVATQSISVPCGDGRNPSPSGEEKSVGVWSRAPVSPWSAHENGPQSSPGVDPEISEARVDWRGGGSCARFDPPDSAGARVGSCQEKWHATTSTCLCRIARIRTSARLSSG